MNKKEFLKLLHKRLNGSATDQEKQLLDNIYDQLQQKEISLSDEIMGDVEETESRLADRIKEAALNSETNIIPKYPWWLKAAACIILLAGLSIIPYLLLKNEQVTPELSAVVKKTLPGQLLKIVLPDSSLVWLNEGSTLLFPQVFSGKSRELTLKGEAFFEVARSSTSPFIVHTGHLETKVLGTSFNVRAYEADTESSVTVVSGKVGVCAAGDIDLSEKEANKSLVLLSENEAVYFDKQTRGITRKKISTAELFTGREKKKSLKYSNIPLWQVVKDIESVYKISISLNKEIKDCPVYGDFDGKTLEDIITIISFSVEASYKKTGDHYYLKGKGCN